MYCCCFTQLVFTHVFAFSIVLLTLESLCPYLESFSCSLRNFINNFLEWDLLMVNVRQLFSFSMALVTPQTSGFCFVSHWVSCQFYFYCFKENMELSRWCSSKEFACQCRRHRRCRFDPCTRKTIWRRKWQLTPVFLPGKFHGQRSLVGYSPWCPKESDTTEQLHNFTPSHTVSASLFSIPVSLCCLKNGFILTELDGKWHFFSWKR